MPGNCNNSDIKNRLFMGRIGNIAKQDRSQQDFFRLFSAKR